MGEGWVFMGLFSLMLPELLKGTHRTWFLVLDFDEVWMESPDWRQRLGSLWCLVTGLLSQPQITNYWQRTKNLFVLWEAELSFWFWASFGDLSWKTSHAKEVVWLHSSVQFSMFRGCQDSCVAASGAGLCAGGRPGAQVELAQMELLNYSGEAALVCGCSLWRFLPICCFGFGFLNFSQNLPETQRIHSFPVLSHLSFLLCSDFSFDESCLMGSSLFC